MDEYFILVEPNIPCAMIPRRNAFDGIPRQYMEGPFSEAQARSRIQE